MFWMFWPKPRFSRSPDLADFCWTGRELRKPNFDLFHQTCSLLFKQQLSENHSCFSSLEETSPWDPAHVKERQIWRPIASTRALYDQMAPQLCKFYVFDFLIKTRPTTLVRKPLEETSPWHHAHVKERQIWRPIASTRALYDQMAPQLCQF